MRPLGHWARGSAALLLGWPFTVVYCTAFVLFSALTLRIWARELVVPAAHIWARALMALSGVRLVYDNDSTIATRRARVIVVNHPGTFDIIWAARLLPPGALPIGKRELIYYPGINIAWWALRFARIDRSDLERARGTLEGLLTMVRDERLSIFIAPEGTRSRDGTLQAFKKGAFHLAMQAEVPVCPVVVSGAYDIWPRDRLLPRPGELRVRFLAPVDTTTWRREDLDGHIERVRADMHAALTELGRP